MVGKPIHRQEKPTRQYVCIHRGGDLLRQPHIFTDQVYTLRKCDQTFTVTVLFYSMCPDKPKLIIRNTFFDSSHFPINTSGLGMVKQIKKLPAVIYK